jgi:hypothetical protein
MTVPICSVTSLSTSGFFTSLFYLHYNMSLSVLLSLSCRASFGRRFDRCPIRVLFSFFFLTSKNDVNLYMILLGTVHIRITGG